MYALERRLNIAAVPKAALLDSPERQANDFAAEAAPLTDQHLLMAAFQRGHKPSKPWLLNEERRKDT